MARLRTSGRLSPCATQSLRKPAAPSARTRVRHSLSRSSEQRTERLSAHQRSSSSPSLRCLGSKKGQARCERSLTLPSLAGRGGTGALITFELRLTLVGEGFVGAPEVVGFHAPRLDPRFGFQRLVDAHVRFGIELALGDAVRDRRALRELVREGISVGHHVLDHAIVEAPFEALLGGHVAAGEQELGGAAAADDPRKDRAGAHVRARQAEADVAGHGEDRAGAGAHALDRRDDRLRTAAHRADQVAGHAGEANEAAAVHLRQRADDLVDVAARAEIAARAADHDDLHMIAVVELVEGGAQFLIAFEGQRVLLLRPVESDGRDAVLELPLEMLRLELDWVEGHALVPPSMVIAAPLMSLLSGRQSMAITLPIACGSTSRPLAFMLVMTLRESASLRPVISDTRATD